MIPAGTGGGERPVTLPRLRRGLDVEIVAARDGGFPAVVVTDPVRGSYFKLMWPSSGLLLLWREAETAEALSAQFSQQYGFAPEAADIKALTDFITHNELSEMDAEGGWKGYARKTAAARHSVMKTLIHNYLFFRIPLVRPDPALRRYLPYVNFAYHRAFWWGVAFVGLAGLYLTTRQWSDVVAAAHRAFEFQQIMAYAIALLLLKGVHELGHAFTAARYGCRVPSMGIAFMVGTPVLYTDTSDSWRLGNDRHRLAIVFAGVAAESVIAAGSLLAWPLLPDGTMRDLCFTFATASIVMTLMVNLNPLMRFDGYFALSDILKVPNLQDRSFALGTWKMREVLFGIGAPPPDTFRPELQRVLIIYAYLTWIYRFFLFLGIAAIVYVVAGKALGIVLAAIEIGVFILMPIVREVKAWVKLKDQMTFNRRALTTAIAVTAVLILAITPSIRSAGSPGVLVAAEEQDLYLPAPATLSRVAVRLNDTVEKGQVLFEATSPDIEHDLKTAQLELKLLTLQLSRLTASARELEETVVLRRSHAAAQKRIEGLEAQRRALNVVAPFAGRIADLDPTLDVGTRVAMDHLLARVVGQDASRVKALIPDTDLARIAAGAEGRFVADEADLAAVPVRLHSIAPASNGALSETSLSEQFGGPVPAVEKDGTLHVRDGWVEVIFSADATPAPPRMIRGSVRFEAEAVSPIALLWRQIGRVLVREQGF